jgi:hypothetical protein
MSQRGVALPQGIPEQDAEREGQHDERIEKLVHRTFER